MRLKSKTGEFRWFYVNGEPERNTAGDIVSWVGAFTDIHERKTVEAQLEQRVSERTRELREANAQLQRSNHDLEQFAFVASHDLQEPLRKVKTFAERLRDEQTAVTEKTSRYIDKISESTQRMSRLINDVLQYARLVRFGDSFEPTDLNAVLKNVVTDYELAIEQKNALVETAELPVVEAVPLQMNQLFNNLVGNSLKFTAPDRAPLVTITSRTLPVSEATALPLNRNGAYCEIKFADNGIGFNQQYAEQIFTIFNRLVGKEDYEGTGIGLALCRKIVTNHQGMISAESKEGEGTSFRVVLPLKQLPA
jgi:two-component system CheB/CheR fusion protein